MFKTVLRSAADNAKRFMIVWLLILIANQVFVFGACFAPYCLAAALPHTLVLALLMNTFGFKREESEKDVSTPAQPKPPRSGAPYAALLALIPVGIIVAITLALSGRSSEPASPTIAHVEASVDEERFSAEDAGERSADLDDDDEFDVNDIETYERVTGTSYDGRTRYSKLEAAREADAIEQAEALERLPFAHRKAGGAPGRPPQGAPAQQAYQCANSSGKPGTGTGRPSQESEYSPFLGKTVRAGEFVIFRYGGAGKEYWFRMSNCVRLG